MKFVQKNINTTFKLATLVFVLFFQHSLQSQSKFVLQNTQLIPIENESTTRDHELIICLPASYYDSPDKKYPVFYFLDAYWHTPLLHAIYGLLRFDNVIPEMIMVGLSYPGQNTNYDSLRLLDLSPTLSESVGPNTGDGPKFLKFLEDVVIPYIETNYRADVDHRALGGTSAGGLFSLFAMYEKPNLFKRHIAISPAVVWNNEDYLLNRNDEYAKLSKELPVRLFLSAGGEEYAPFRDPIFKLQEQIQENKYKNLALLNHVVEGERHTGVCAEGYTRGLRWIFSDLKPAGPSGLAKIFGEVD